MTKFDIGSQQPSTKKAQSLIPLWGLDFGPLWFGGGKAVRP